MWEYEKSLPGTTYKTVWDKIFIISVTQTTIGYGDTVPLSHIGRTICVFSGVFGVFLNSYMLLSVTRACELNDRETLFFSSIKYQHLIKHALKPTAILAIQKWWKFMLRRKNKLLRVNQLAIFFIQLEKFSFQRAKLLESKNDSTTDSLNKFTSSTEIKFSSCLRHLDSFANQEKTGLEYVKREYSNLNHLQSIKSRILSMTSIRNNEIKTNSLIVYSGVSKEKMKLLQDRAIKRMRTIKGGSPGNSGNFANYSRDSRTTASVYNKS